MNDKKLSKDLCNSINEINYYDELVNVNVHYRSGAIDSILRIPRIDDFEVLNDIIRWGGRMPGKPTDLDHSLMVGYIMGINHYPSFGPISKLFRSDISVFNSVFLNNFTIGLVHDLFEARWGDDPRPKHILIPESKRFEDFGQMLFNRYFFNRDIEKYEYKTEDLCVEEIEKVICGWQSVNGCEHYSYLVISYRYLKNMTTEEKIRLINKLMLHQLETGFINEWV